MGDRIPTFAVFKDNKKVPTLIHCFIKESRVQKDDYLNCKGFHVKNQFYEIQWDDSVFPDLVELKKGQYMNVAISFQKHNYGSFAIVKRGRIG